MFLHLILPETKQSFQLYRLIKAGKVPHFPGHFTVRLLNTKSIIKNDNVSASRHGTPRKLWPQSEDVEIGNKTGPGLARMWEFILY